MARREANHIRQDIQEDLNAIEGMKALFKAASTGDVAAIRHILTTSPRVDVNSEDINLATALHMAAMNNHAETVAVLVEHGARIDQTDKSNTTPLYTAVSRGAKEAAEKLVAAGADMSIPCGNGMAPLHASVAMDSPAITRMLLENGADITQTTDGGMTPMELAQMYDHVQQITALQEVVSARHTRRLKNLHDRSRRRHIPRA